MEKSLNIYFNSIDKSRISHSFLIGNTNIDLICDQLNEIFLSDIFNMKYNIFENPDIIIINPINNLIKKDNVEQIHLFIRNTSQLSGKKIYIINKCECLNKQAANSLLKILEEPKNNIYAFLITSNFNDVLPTIISRCQKICISTAEDNNLINDDSIEIFSNCFKIVKLLEQKKVNSLPYILNIIGKKIDKQEIRIYIQYFELIYKELFNIEFKNKLEIFLDYKQQFFELFNLSKSSNFIYKLITLENIQQNLDKNLNQTLFIDKLILDLGRSDFNEWI